MSIMKMKNVRNTSEKDISENDIWNETAGKRQLWKGALQKLTTLETKSMKHDKSEKDESENGQLWEGNPENDRSEMKLSEKGQFWKG